MLCEFFHVMFSEKMSASLVTELLTASGFVCACVYVCARSAAR